jgi:signal recognition particle subunit SRP54
VAFEGLSDAATYSKNFAAKENREEDVKLLCVSSPGFAEADVNFKVVKDFVERVRQRAVGQEVLRV